MLVDAIRSELVRFWHNGNAVFWGLFFVPVSSLLIGIFWRFYLENTMKAASESLPAQLLQRASVTNLGDRLTEKASILAEPGLMAFFLLAAASVFATDYRWESWRLIRVRNSRENLIIGKAVTIALLALVPVLGLLLAEGFGQLVSATLDKQKIVLGFEAGQVATTLLMIVVAWIRVCQFAFIALAVAVFTRSIAATIIVPIAFAAGTFLLQRMTGNFGWQPQDLNTLISFPAVAHELIQSALLGARIDGLVIIKALSSLLLWLAAPVALAVWWFSRQDLSKE